MLNGLTLTVNPGEVVALVGASGSGKSSIVKLIERFYVPSAGEVLVDGRDVGDWHPGWLKRRVALVGQEPVLYGRSVHDNIVLGLGPGSGRAGGETPTRDEVRPPSRCHRTRGGVRGVTRRGRARVERTSLTGALRRTALSRTSLPPHSAHDTVCRVRWPWSPYRRARGAGQQVGVECAPASERHRRNRLRATG